MSQSNCDFTTFKLQGKAERFIKIGSVGSTTLPKDMYETAENGVLAYYPVADEHFRNVRTKSQRGTLPMLLKVGYTQEASLESTVAPKEPIKSKHIDKDVSPKSLLFDYVQELVKDAGKSGDLSMSLRCERKLHRLISACVDVAAKEILHAALEKYANEKDTVLPLKHSSSSPEKVISGTATTVITPGTRTVEIELDAVVEEGILETDDEDDRSVTSTSTTDEFLAELQEEVILQSLLHKWIHDRKERVFQLEHHNGRRLLVVLPPDTQSVASFEEEAMRTNWVNIMLNTEEHVEGMLSHLAKSSPEKYTRIGQKRKLSMQTVTLNTVQTIALARVGRLNDVRMKKIKSFLRQVGKVNLQMSIKEQERIDIKVGLHRTKDTIYGTYLHEWALAKGKEKKPPEQVHYWNCSLSNEIEAEVDLYLNHLFLENEVDNNNTPSIDYIAGGFD
jgi:hypothetical protein